MNEAPPNRSMQAVKLYCLTLGARNAGGKSRHFLSRDERAIHHITRDYFPDGFTITSARGGWWDKTACAFMLEDSRQISVRSPSRARVRRWARDLGARLGQKELLVVEVGPAFVVPAASDSRR